MKVKFNLESILTFEKIVRSTAIVFSVLAIFFLTLPTSLLSPYMLIARAFGVYGSFGVYYVVSNIVYWGSFITGLLLLLSFPVSAKSGRRAEMIAAVNFALHGFVLQASAALWRHKYSLETYHPSTHGVGWLILDMFLLANLLATFILLVTVWTLLTNHKWAHRLGMTISVLLLASYLISPGSPFFPSPLERTVLFGLVTAMSIYYLWRTRRKEDVH